MASPNARYNGWWKDNHNERLYFYQAGTAIGYIDAVSGLEILTGSLNVSGGAQVAGGLSATGGLKIDGGADISGASTLSTTTFKGPITISEPVTYADTFRHANRKTLTLTAGATLTITSVGCLIEMSGPATASAETITMPNVSAGGYVGAQWTIVNTYPDGVSGGLLTIDVSSSTFVGGGLSAVSGLDLVNPAATHIHGDYVTLAVGDLSTYFIIDMAGTWTLT